MLDQNYSPYLNQTDSNRVQQPRAIVLINGINVLWYTVEVTTTTFYMADSYSLTLPMSQQPAAFNMEFLATTAPIKVEIYMGFPANPDQYNVSELTKMMTGVVDRLTIDPLTRTVTIEGRDLTSTLIDTKTYQKFSNQTSSDIAILFAKEHGLGTSQITKTNTTVGTFYTYENTLMTRETTEWDLLTFLGQQQDFVVYVSDNDLVFKPRPTVETAVPYILNYQAPNKNTGSPDFPGMTLSLSRSLTLAALVTVKIRVPVNPLTGRSFTQTISSKNRSNNSTGTQVYTYTLPGLTPAQALTRGQQILNDIIIHELRLNVSMPGDVILKKDSLIQLRGTNSSLDQIYFPDMIVRTMSFESDVGFQQTISAKNHSTSSQVLL